MTSGQGHFFVISMIKFQMLILKLYLRTQRSYPDRNEFTEEGSLGFLGIRRFGVVFSHMSPSWSSRVTISGAHFALHSWAQLRPTNGCPVSLQALNLLAEDSLSLHQLSCPVRLDGSE